MITLKIKPSIWNGQETFRIYWHTDTKPAWKRYGKQEFQTHTAARTAAIQAIQAAREGITLYE
jgi:hypothetical protein